MKKVLPGDIVLADQGFDIDELIAMEGAELHIPACTRGKKQLSGKEVELSKKIENVRIHVERVSDLLWQKNIPYYKALFLSLCYLIWLDKKNQL